MSRRVCGLSLIAVAVFCAAGASYALSRPAVPPRWSGAALLPFVVAVGPVLFGLRIASPDR